MSSNDKPYRGLVAVAVFILLEIAAVGLLKRSESLQNIWINRFNHRVLAAIWGGGEKIRGYFSLGGQNEELAAENFKLRRELQHLKDNIVDAGLVESAKGISDNRFVYIPAQVVKISRNSQHNYIILNKGAADGITPQSGIITGSGIVGIVDAVDEHYSYGLTIMNNRVSVSVRTGESGVVTPLVWDGRTSNGAILREFPIQTKVEPGDTVVTSGLSSVFPGDVPVGITGRKYSRSGSSGEVEVTLFQDFSTIKYVIVTSDPSRGEIEALEKKEGKE